MLAEVTYNAGKSYRLKNYKFLQGKTVLVKDAAVIDRCRATAGFAVHVLTKKDQEDKRRKKAPEVERVKTVGSKTSEERKAAKAAPKKKVRVPTATKDKKDDKVE